MSDTIPNESLPSKQPASPLRKAVKILLWSLASIIGIIIIAAIGATLYLSPSRVAGIVNKEASKYLKADVKVSDVNWTLWSSFPWLKVDIDSVNIKSRTLDSIPLELRRQLPANSDSLLATGRIRGAVNIIKAIKGEIALRGIEAVNPKVNLVAVNDSVANYLIFPTLDTHKEMPSISLDTIDIGRPLTISYSNLQQDMEVKAKVERLGLSEVGGNRNLWQIALTAIVSARSGEFSLPAGIPVNLTGKVGFADNMKKIDLQDFNISLANIAATTEGTIHLADNPTLYPFQASVNIPDILDLLPYIPENLLPPSIKDVEGNLPLSVKGNLLSPLTLAKGGTSIPALTATVASDGGNISFLAGKSQKVALSGLGLDLTADIDPAAPEESKVNLKDLRMETDGTSLHITGLLSRALTPDPDVSLNLLCAADLQKATQKILPGSGMTVTGDLSGQSELSCKLADLSKKQLKNVKLDGDFEVAALSLNDAASKMAAHLSDFSLKIGADVPQIAPSSLSDGKITLLTYVGKGDFTMPSSGMKTTLSNTTLKGDFQGKGSMSSPQAEGTLTLTADEIKGNQGSTLFSTNGLDAKFTGNLRQIPYSPSNFYPTTPTSKGDSAVAADVKHTPLYLIPSVPPMLQSVLSLLNLKGTVAAKGGTLQTEAWPGVNSFSDLRLATNLDTLQLSSVRFQTRGASGFLSGKVNGLRGFLSSSSAVPLNAEITADLDEVDINRLSGNYFRGVRNMTGREPELLPPAPGPYTAADSLCIALPRNLSVDARLAARSASYMQYQFSPLSTRIIMRKGDATLKDLSIGTTFCADNITWTYSTADLDSISMDINADISDFDFVKFRKAFPELEATSPQLANLSLDAGVKVNGNFLMDPDMFLNAPSMEGDMSVKVRNFSFVRDKKALKYTHLMMIRGDGPITIDTLDIHAAFHDNLLQLDPFTIDGGGYKLLIGGVNNLMGQMYYHIGLLHNPLHLPFGVNLVGYFHHPELRFGGRWIKDGRERKIAAELGSDVHVNIMRNLSHGWLLFVGNAAKYDFKNNSGEDSNVR